MKTSALWLSTALCAVFGGVIYHNGGWSKSWEKWNSFASRKPEVVYVTNYVNSVQYESVSAWDKPLRPLVKEEPELLHPKWGTYGGTWFPIKEEDQTPKWYTNEGHRFPVIEGGNLFVSNVVIMGHISNYNISIFHQNERP